MKARLMTMLAAFLAAQIVQTAAARTDVDQQDCAALEYVLSLEGQLSDLDLDERDAVARRIERHGEALGLSATQVRLQALALRDNDSDLSDLILSENATIQQAHADCLQNVETNGGDKDLALKNGQPRIARGGGSSRFAGISFSGQQISVPWSAFAGLSVAIVLIGALIWMLIVAERRKRRRSPRYNCDIPAVFRLEDGPELSVRVTDISLKGCCLTLPNEVTAPGLRTTLDLGRTIIAARVVWHNKYFCGVEFTTELSQDQVQDLLRQDYGNDLATAAS